MKITLERKNDLILRSPVYVLTVGTHKYHYEKLSDVLLREAVLFEPHQEEKKPERTKNIIKKKNNSKKEIKPFPLGKTIISILKGASKPMIVEDFMGIIPRKYTLSIWGMVLKKLVKSGQIKMIPLENGGKFYELIK